MGFLRVDDIEHNDDQTVIPAPKASPEVVTFQGLLESVISTREEYQRARRSVPNYTGQWSDSDYYSSELHEYNVASQALLDFLKA